MAWEYLWAPFPWEDGGLKHFEVWCMRRTKEEVGSGFSHHTALTVLSPTLDLGQTLHVSGFSVYSFFLFFFLNSFSTFTLPSLHLF